MISKVLTVYDSKAESYMRPFFEQSRGQAIRAFTEISNDPQSAICRHPADFTLFELGEFDHQAAAFKLHSTPVSLGLALEFKNQSALQAGSQQPLPLKEAK